MIDNRVDEKANCLVNLKMKEIYITLHCAVDNIRFVRLSVGYRGFFSNQVVEK